MFQQLSNSSLLADRGLFDKLIPTIQNNASRGGRLEPAIPSTGDLQQRDSFALFNSILKQSYEKLAFSPGVGKSFSGSVEQNGKLEGYAAPAAENGRISARQAAGNILKFITQKVQSDAAGGADQEALLDRLEQGQKGFEKGFNEAKQILTDMGLLTPELEAEIGDTYDLVTQGIENLRSIITGENQANQVLENGVIDAGGAEIASSSVNSSTTSRLTSIQADAYRENNFSLELTTQDGDRVTIDINRIRAASFSASQGSNGQGGSSLQVSGSQFQSSSFELTVQGELDEGELEAINQLLTDIDAIAGEFYGGNLEKAFNLATELQLDKDELATLDLELKQTTVISAIASYQSVSQDPNEPDLTSDATEDLRILKQLFDSVSDIVNNARRFDNPNQLLEQITANFKPAALETSEVAPQEANSNPLFDGLQNLISRFDI
jgi:hypothetical protein